MIEETIRIKAVFTKEGNFDGTIAQIKQLDKATGSYSITEERVSKGGRRLGKSFVEAGTEAKRFKYEALGVMFAGMSLERAFGKVTKAGYDLYGVTEILGESMGVAMLPMMDLIGPALFDLADAIMGLSEDPVLGPLIGGFMLLGNAIGGMLSGLGQAILFLSSLEQIGGIGGLFTELTKIYTLLTGLVGKALVAIVDVVMNLVGTAAKLIGTAGEWLLTNAKIAVDATQGAIDKLVLWLFGEGTLASTAKLVISIGVAFVILDIATRVIGWLFTIFGSAPGISETKLGKVMVDIGVNMQEGYFDFLFDAFFSKKYAEGAQLYFKMLIDLMPQFNITSGTLSWLPEFLKNIVTGKALTAEIFIDLLPFGSFFEVVKVLSNLFSPNVSYVPPGQIKHAAEGGIFTKPTMALIGESGPEAVVPLNNTSNSFTSNYNINTSVANDVDIASLARRLNDYLVSDYRRLTY